MFDRLLDELLFDILLRLPLKTLIICACTSKTLKSFINSPGFVAAHRNKSKENPYVFIRYYIETNDHYKHHVNEIFGLRPDDESSSVEDFRMDIRMPKKCYASSYFGIVGCCNGVFCLSEKTHAVYLWNPSIRKCVTLPLADVSYLNYGCFEMCLGFGFDEVANDYKVVRVVYLNHGKTYAEDPVLVEIYTLSSGSWRYVNTSRPKHEIVSLKCSQCFFKGSVHWLGCKRGDLSAIVSFSFLDESFGEMELPASLDRCNTKINLRVCWGMLALICVNSKCRIWAMNEYGAKDSWTEMFTFDTSLYPMIRTISTRENEEVLMLLENSLVNEVYEDGIILGNPVRFCVSCSRGHKMLSVNRIGGLIKELGAVTGSLKGCYMGSYEESLALFNEGKLIPDVIKRSNESDDSEIKDAEVVGTEFQVSELKTD